MLNDLLSFQTDLAAFLSRVGLERYTTYVMILGPLLGLALLRAVYVGVVYRRLSDAEIAQMQYDPEMIETAAKGRIRRW